MTSRDIVVAAPMSFTGSAQRIWRLSQSAAVRLFFLLPLILLVWCIIVPWYACFGVFLIPYRLIRRGGRNRKLRQRQHEELVAAVASVRH